MKSFSIKNILLASVLVLVLISPAFANVKVAATIYPIHDIVRQIGGDRVESFYLVPIGASPHTFAPTPQLLARMESSQIVFAVGLGVDDWVSRAMESKTGGPVIVSLSEGLTDQLQHELEHGHHEEHHGHDGINPHIWLDPEMIPRIAERIRDSLIDADPDGASAYRANTQKLIDAFKDFEARTLPQFEQYKGRAIVVVHSAYDYLCHWLGIEQLVITVSPGAEPSAGSLAELITNARKHNAGAVYREPQLSSRVAQTLAQELGVPLLVLDPLGDPAVQGRDTLLGLYNFNVQQILKGFER